MSITSWIRNRFHPMWRLRRMRWFQWAQNQFDVPVSRRVGCVRVHSYFLRDLGWFRSLDQPEPKVADVLAALLAQAEVNCFIDVGAHIGSYSWLMANRRPDARLFLFEPDRKNIRLLERTIKKSGLARARLVPCALSDQDNEAVFLVDDASGMTGSLIDQRGEPGGYNLHASYGLTVETIVRTRRLDEFMPEFLGTAILLKIDVEGAEHHVLAGAHQVLARLRPMILCESFQPFKLRALIDHRYVILRIDENSNYVALPREKRSLLADIALFDVTAEISEPPPGGTISRGG